jgi:hypothetical protein
MEEGYGGPVWHASAASTHRISGIGRAYLEQKAREALDGVGDRSAGEWVEWTGIAAHVRRRLTPEEAEIVGPVVDVRGTDEAKKRPERAWLDLPPVAREIARQEITA